MGKAKRWNNSKKRWRSRSMMDSPKHALQMKNPASLQDFRRPLLKSLLLSTGKKRKTKLLTQRSHLCTRDGMESSIATIPKVTRSLLTTKLWASTQSLLKSRLLRKRRELESLSKKALLFLDEPTKLSVSSMITCFRYLSVKSRGYLMRLVPNLVTRNLFKLEVGCSLQLVEELTEVDLSSLRKRLSH